MSVLVEDKDATIERLSQAGIDSRPFFVPMPDLPHLALYATGPVPVAARLHRHGVASRRRRISNDAAQDRVIAALLDA